MRHDPWSSWIRMWEAGLMMSETLSAAARVIDHRRATLGRALHRRPHADDGRELTRMVTEKVDAFGQAGFFLAQDWWRMQADLARQGLAVGQALAARSAGLTGARAMAARQLRIGEQALASAARALKPIHAAATANDRRLGRAARK